MKIKFEECFAYTSKRAGESRTLRDESRILRDYCRIEDKPYYTERSNKFLRRKKVKIYMLITFPLSPYFAVPNGTISELS